MKGNLLLIDDEIELLWALEKSLGRQADAIYTAKSGEEGLQILEEKKIHCVVCDIRMPGIDGVETLRRIRLKHQTLPVIMFTGHGNTDLMKEVAKLGATDFVDKPNFEGLQEVVSRGLYFGLKQNESQSMTDNDYDDFKILLGNVSKE